MRRDRAGQDGNVVSPFEHAHDPAPGMSFGDGDDLPREDLEILDFQAQVAHRVFGVGVEARADQNRAPAECGRPAFRDLTEMPHGTRFVAVP